jgi:hypothetical protein
MGFVADTPSSRFVPDSAPKSDDAPKPSSIRSQLSIPPPTPEQLRMRGVARNAVVEGLAGVPDMFLNAPANLWNLGKAGFGTAAIAAGRPDLAPDLTPTPNLINRGARAVGLTKAENEPQTSKERLFAAALRGGSGMLLAPGSVGPNVVTGALSGLAGEGVEQATGSPTAGLVASLATPAVMQAGRGWATGKIADAAARKSTNLVEDSTLADARSAGFRIPVSQADPGGMRGYINDRVESLGGKAAIKQDAALKNAEIRKQLAATELGMPPSTALTVEKLDNYRAASAAPYQEVAALPTMAPVRTMVNTNPNRNPYPQLTPQQPAAEALRDLKQARYDANNTWREYNRTGEVSTLEAAKNLSAKVDALESHLQNTAAAAGRPELSDALAAARTKIAKSYDVEQALNPGSADISGAPFAAKLKAQRPLTGNLETIGRTQQAFPQVMGNAERVQAPGVSYSELLSSGIFGGLGHLAFGLPGTAAAALPLAIPAVRAGARKLALNPSYAKMMERNYEPPMLAKILGESTTTPQDAAYRAALVGALRAQQQGAQQ